jgi:SAM-dependent methyltransferase
MNAPMIQPHNVRVAATWDSAGRQYDRISQSIADAIEHYVLRLAPAPGERILDVAARAWLRGVLRRAGPAPLALTWGLISSKPPRRMPLRRACPSSFVWAMREVLPFEDHRFDAVISTFGVMFVSKPEAAVAELARVCKPRGRLGLVTWAADGTAAGFFKVLQPYLPAPAVPPPPSPFAWGNKERLQRLLGSAFERHFETGTTVLREQSGLAVWELLVEGYGPTKVLAAALDAAAAKT